MSAITKSDQRIARPINESSACISSSSMAGGSFGSSAFAGMRLRGVLLRRDFRLVELRRTLSLQVVDDDRLRSMICRGACLARDRNSAVACVVVWSISLVKFSMLCGFRFVAELR